MDDSKKRRPPVASWGQSQRSIRRRALNSLDEELGVWAASESREPEQGPSVSSLVNSPSNSSSSSSPVLVVENVSVNEGDPTDCMSFEDGVETLPFRESQPFDVAPDVEEESGDIQPDEHVESASSTDVDEWYDAEDFGFIMFDCDSCFQCKCVACGICAHSTENNCTHCDDCKADVGSEIDESEDSCNSVSDEDFACQNDENRGLSEDFVSLVLSENLQHKQIEALLKFFRKWNFGKLPLNPRTLLKTPVSYDLREVKPGQYWHRGIKNDLHTYITESGCSEVKIKFNTDGLPISRSSGSAFWPILCSFNDSKNVVLAGIFYGSEKPEDANDFMKDFVEEIQDYCENGIEIDNRLVTVFLSQCVCDAPAKALILCTKAHNAYYGCTKCSTKGKMYGRRMSYPHLNASLRTNDSFRNQEQPEHHKGNSILLKVPKFDPVASVPLEFLHLTLLGTLRKIIYMWIGGPLTVRLSQRLINNISEAMVSLSGWTPSDFVRKPRSLNYVKRFKGTEYRQLLFYTGPLVFKNYLRSQLYEHFLTLHVAFYILAHPEFSLKYVDYANDLLRYWVSVFKRLYGAEYVSHNIHGLIHVSADVKLHGTVDSYSGFMFENYLQILKKMVRKGDKPLAQLIRRFMEAEKKGLFKHKPEPIPGSQQNPEFFETHTKGPLSNGTTGPQFYKCQLSGGITFNCNNEANNCCTLKTGSVVLIRNFAFSLTLQCMVAIGKRFLKYEDVYDHPVKSSFLGIHYVYNLHRSLQCWPVSDIDRKCYRMPFKNGYAIVPMLHRE